MSETASQPAVTPRLERLGAHDLRVLLIWILAGALSVGVASRYFFQAFPEASIHFEVTRDQALDTARQFLSEQHAALNGYESTIVFNVDDNAKTYLERTVGLEQANQLISTQVSVWYWEARFFRPEQKEEYRVDVSPSGRLVGFEHIVEESRSGARLERDAALAIAANFLRAQDPARFTQFDYVPEEANLQERPNRRDWSFTWELRGFRAPDSAQGAPYRLTVGLQGDQVSNLDEFLKVPETWTRGYENLRSANTFITNVALIPYMLLLGGAFWILYELSRRGVLRFAGSLWLGMIFAILFFLMTVNTWPIMRAGYDTNSSYSSWTVEQLMFAALLSIGEALLVTIAFAPGEALYRNDFPKFLRLGALRKIPALQSKEFFRSCVIGVSLAAVHIGYVVVFYLVGKRFGVWAPQEVSYDQETSSILPWLAPLVIGLYASASEEFLFRMFAIPFLRRITKSRILAVVLPAFMWSFLHANYPQEPPYIRGIEIGIIGIVAGLVMLRWGILATLVWHYTVDATLGSLLLIRSANPYFRVSGALVAGAAFIPILHAGVMYLRRGGFVVNEELLNAAEPLQAPAEADVAAADQQSQPATSANYRAMSAKLIWTLILCGIAGILVIKFASTPAIGSFVRTSLDSKQAAAEADDILREKHVDPSKFHRATAFVSNFDPIAQEFQIDPLVNEFLRRKVGIESANRIYQSQVPQGFWRVRYFKSSEKEEYAVILQSSGQLYSVWHSLDERTPGAKLTKEEALARAESWLRSNRSIDFSQWELVEYSSEEKPDRLDHKFIWQNKSPVAGGPNPEDAAYARMDLHVVGDEISIFFDYFKIPDDWRRQQEHGTLLKTLHAVWKGMLPAALIITMLVVYFRNLKRPEAASIPWRKFAGWSLWGLIAFAVLEITSIPVTLQSYTTQLPFKVFLATIGISWLIGAFFFYAAIAFFFGLAWYFWSRAGQNNQLPEWFHMPADYYRDAFLIATAGAATFIGFTRGATFLARLVPALRDALPASVPSGFDALLPAAQEISRAVYMGLLVAAIIAAASGFITLFARTRLLRALLVVAGALAMIGGWGSGADFLRQFALYAVTITFWWLAISKIVRFNLLGYFLLIAVISLASGALPLLQQPNSYLRTNGVAVLASLALLMLWPLIAWRRAASRRSSTSAI
ncbi:MAG: CPBP family intramembrane glutamic endopeptidase [Candidatus Acidiferrales bacterium]